MDSQGVFGECLGVHEDHKSKVCTQLSLFYKNLGIHQWHLLTLKVNQLILSPFFQETQTCVQLIVKHESDSNSGPDN